jgi:dCMP deaminase
MSATKIVPLVKKMDRWESHFMQTAMLAATMSDDRSTKVGCVIVKENAILASGCNTFPRGCYVNGEDLEPHLQMREYMVSGIINPESRARILAPIESRHDKPAKYLWTEHAERNAIYGVARRGGPALQGSAIYVPWFPCADCARAIIQSGISQVVAYLPDFDHPKYGPDFKVAVQMFKESGVDVRYVERLEAAK